MTNLRSKLKYLCSDSTEEIISLLLLLMNFGAFISVNLYRNLISKESPYFIHSEILSKMLNISSVTYRFLAFTVSAVLLISAYRLLVKTNKIIKEKLPSNSISSLVVILLSVCPFFLSGFSFEYFGSIHILLMIISIFIIYFINEDKLFPLCLILIVISELLFGFYILIYFPLILLTLEYKSLSEQSNKNVKTNRKQKSDLDKLSLFKTLSLIVAVITSVVSLAAGNLYMKSHTFSESFSFWDIYLFSDISDNIRNTMFEDKTVILSGLLNQVIITVPFIAAFIYFCLGSIKNSSLKDFKAFFIKSLIYISGLYIISIVFFNKSGVLLTVIPFIGFLLIYSIIVNSKDISQVISKNIISKTIIILALFAAFCISSVFYKRYLFNSLWALTGN